MFDIGTLEVHVVDRDVTNGHVGFIGDTDVTGVCGQVSKVNLFLQFGIVGDIEVHHVGQCAIFGGKVDKDLSGLDVGVDVDVAGELHECPFGTEVCGDFRFDLCGTSVLFVHVFMVFNGFDFVVESDFEIRGGSGGHVGGECQDGKCETKDDEE